MGGNFNTTRRNTSQSDVSRNVSLKINTERTQSVFGSGQQNAGPNIGVFIKNIMKLTYLLIQIVTN